jgi:hypothetical protein
LRAVSPITGCTACSEHAGFSGAASGACSNLNVTGVRLSEQSQVLLRQGSAGSSSSRHDLSRTRHARVLPKVLKSAVANFAPVIAHQHGPVRADADRRGAGDVLLADRARRPERDPAGRIKSPLRVRSRDRHRQGPAPRLGTRHRKIGGAPRHRLTWLASAHLNRRETADDGMRVPSIRSAYSHLPPWPSGYPDKASGTAGRAPYGSPFPADTQFEEGPVKEQCEDAQTG